MRDLKERFGSLDRLAVPDLRSEIQVRPPPRSPTPRLTQRVGSAVVAVAVAAAGAYVVVRAFAGPEEPGRLRPAGEVRNGRIAFVRNGDIWTVNPDGSDVVQLTEASRTYFYEGAGPAWSPDGQKIAFSSARGDADLDLFVMDADGSDRVVLFSDPTGSTSPSWSPDGTQIAFESGMSGESRDIWLIGSDGRGRQQLTNGPAREGWPSWSPDGSRIAFMRRSPSGTVVVVMDADGSNGSPVTDGTDPSWSPGGNEIAFLRDGDVWLMAPDGSNARHLTADGIYENVAWSPDGRQLVLGDRDGRLYTANADGSDITRIPRIEGCCVSWQPLVSTTPSPPAVDESDVDARRTETVELPGFPGAVAADEGSVWVLVGANPAPLEELVRIDSRTNEIVARIPLEGISWDSEMALGSGSVWVGAWLPGEGSAVVRVDAATNQVVATIPGAGGDLSFASGSLWARGTDDERSVVRIDPATNAIVDGVALGDSPHDIAATNDAVWLLLLAHGGGEYPGGLLKLDPNSSDVVAEIDLDASGTSVAAERRIVWVAGALAGANSAVWAIDAQTHQPLASAPHTDEFRPFAADEGGVWYLRGWEGLCRRNASTLEVEGCVNPGPVAPAYVVTAAFDPATETVWVANDARTVTRIDVTPAP